LVKAGHEEETCAAPQWAALFLFEDSAFFDNLDMAFFWQDYRPKQVKYSD